MSGKTSRRKGHDYERAIRKEFRQLGWKYCETSRYASKAIDDAKIDLVKLPFNYEKEIIIVDNNSQDGTKEFLQKLTELDKYKIIFLCIFISIRR